MTPQNDFMRRAASNRVPRGAKLLDLYHQLLEYPQVVGCMLAEKRTSGRPTGALCIVACVSEKVPEATLAKKARIPNRLTWRTGKSVKAIPVDVQQLQDSGHESAPLIGGPGDMFQGRGPCTCGVSIAHPIYGDVITTAGHGFQKDPGHSVVYPPGALPRVKATNFDDTGRATSYSANLIKTSITNSTDYALLKPDTPIVANYYRDTYQVSGVVDPAGGDVNHHCYVLSATGRKSTSLRGIQAWVDIAGFPMSDLILTSYATNPGDSGCLLIDEQFRAFGTLVGFVYIDRIKYSAFASVTALLGAESSTLI